jgi:hypothetical protein
VETCDKCHAEKNGKFIPQPCVVPIVADQFDWPFLTRTGDEWVVLKNDKPVYVQHACYGTLLTKKQIKKMAIPLKK